MVEHISGLQALADALAKVRAGMESAQQTYEAARLTFEALADQVHTMEKAIEIVRGQTGVPLVEAAAPIHRATRTLMAERRQFLRAQAALSGGVIALRDFGPEMVQTGLYRSMEQFRSQIYRLIGDMEEFESVEPGIYMLMTNDLPGEVTVEADEHDDDDHSVGNLRELDAMLGGR